VDRSNGVRTRKSDRRDKGADFSFLNLDPWAIFGNLMSIFQAQRIIIWVAMVARVFFKKRQTGGQWEKKKTAPEFQLCKYTQVNYDTEKNGILSF